MYDSIAIIGYSGHGYVVVDTAYAIGLSLTHYVERSELVDNPFQLKYLGSEEQDHFSGWNGEYGYILGIGNNAVRSKLGLLVLSHRQELLNVIHPDASVSEFAEIGVGTFISRLAAVNSFAKIGKFCILNTGCIVEHECVLHDGVHIAPGAVLAGNVEVGKLSFIGANSVVKQGIKIGSNVIIGAGAVVLNDVPDHKVIVGNPGKIR